MTIGEMDPNFDEKWAAASAGCMKYENILHLNFEHQADMNYVIELIRNDCMDQDIMGEVTIVEGTLKTTYSYEHDGT